jgi:hypothetical protein
MNANRRAKKMKIEEIEEFLKGFLEEDVHAKRIFSLSDATLGVMTSGAMAIHAVGHGISQARGVLRKHAIKQVDRLLSNKGVDVWDLFGNWVPEIVAKRKEIVVAMDWTDYDADGQATLAINLVTAHGRATPLVWLTAEKASLKNNRNHIEDTLLQRFHSVLPDTVENVIVLADRGFGDHKLFQFLAEDLGFNYVIRIRGDIIVESEKGESRKGADWVGKGGRAKMLRNARVTGRRLEVPTVVCVHAKDMKEPWCLVASFRADKSKDLVKYYAKRWSIEPSFRDTKDLRFGMGLKSIHIRNPERRDRLLLINAFAVVLLTVLGEAGEAIGFDRMLKANTTKRRVYSLFRQGCIWYELIPAMPEDRLRKLMAKFSELMLARSSFEKVYGFV